MIAFDLPATLRASAADPQPAEVRCYLEPPLTERGYKQVARGVTVHPCTVVTAEPLTVTFSYPMSLLHPGRDMWRDEHGEPFGEIVPSGTPVVLNDSAHRVACTYDEFEEWNEQRRNRDAGHLEGVLLQLEAERVRDDLGLTPVGADWVRCCSASLLAHFGDYTKLLREVEELRADHARVEEILLADEEERAAIAQAERDGLRRAS